jgi:hypothetical protein
MMRRRLPNCVVISLASKLDYRRITPGAEAVTNRIGDGRVRPRPLSAGALIATLGSAAWLKPHKLCSFMISVSPSSGYALDDQGQPDEYTDGAHAGSGDRHPVRRSRSGLSTGASGVGLIRSEHSELQRREDPSA